MCVICCTPVFHPPHRYDVSVQRMPYTASDSFCVGRHTGAREPRDLYIVCTPGTGEMYAGSALPVGAYADWVKKGTHCGSGGGLGGGDGGRGGTAGYGGGGDGGGLGGDGGGDGD